MSSRVESEEEEEQSMKRTNSESSLDNPAATRANKKSRFALEEAQSIRKARTELVANRDKILEQLPDSYKKSFNEIGFTKWEDTLLPVLIVNPFDVRENPVRNDWLKLFRRAKKRGKVESVPWVVYWYGFTTPVGEYYSFVNEKNITLYEKARKEGTHKLPENVKQAIAAREKLTTSDQELVRAFKEMEGDLKQPPASRRRAVVHSILKSYDMLTVDDANELKSFLKAEMSQRLGIEESDEHVTEDVDRKPRASNKITRNFSVCRKSAGNSGQIYRVDFPAPQNTKMKDVIKKAQDLSKQSSAGVFSFSDDYRKKLASKEWVVMVKIADKDLFYTLDELQEISVFCMLQQSTQEPFRLELQVRDKLGDGKEEIALV